MSAPAADLQALAASHDILAIGMLADEARQRAHGRRTTFVRVSDVAVASDAPIVIGPSAGEVRLVGTPASCAQAVARVRAVAALAGDIPLSGYSLADLELLAARESMTLRQLLEDLHAAGMELVAEAPIDRLRDARRAIEEVNIAGLALARLTVEQLPEGDNPSLFETVSELQRAVAVIRAFAPLPRRFNPSQPTTGYDDVKRVALARLFLDNVPSIQVDWALYGPKLAQVALTFGADDVDGVSPVDDLSEGPRRATRRDLERQVRAAGFEPTERNGRFDLVTG